MEERPLRWLRRALRRPVRSVAGSRFMPLVTAVAALAAAAAPAWATGDLPNTLVGDPAAQLAAPPSVAQKLTLPFDGTPAAGTGDTGSPEDDLAGALDALAAAPDAAAAG